MVLATSAHAAFEKAAHYFGVESRRVPVRPDLTADPDATAGAIDDDTVLVVGSAPTYPHGVIDPIDQLGELAADRGILCHVDACLGGFIRPFLERLGHVSKPWNLSVPGVSSISADLHKYGYGSKGVSVIVYRDRHLARLQPFVTANWLGGQYGSPAMAGTRPAGPIAAGWAVLHHLGLDGYLRLADASHTAATALIDAIESEPGLTVRGRPDATVLAFGSDPDHPGIDTFALGDALAERGGWYFDRQSPPDSLHATVHAGHAAVIDAVRADLTAVSAELRSTGLRATDRSTTYGTR
jgi:glutamate/tyrosine decarboxylase-like PLP-dependent enzyme